MNWITNSKIFKGSKYQDKILAAISDPINKPLVQQLASYVDEEYLEPEVNDDALNKLDTAEPSSEEGFEIEPELKKSENSHPVVPSSPHISKAPGPSVETPEDIVDDENHEPLAFEEPPEGDEKLEPDEADVKENTQVNAKTIAASTYVDVATVSQAVTEIPGTLNLREETAGVTYSTLKGGATSELWIYYDNEVDINKVLDKVIPTLLDSGYYFLEFNRVSRDENAIIFSVNWISNYFNPRELKGSADEE